MESVEAQGLDMEDFHSLLADGQVKEAAACLEAVLQAARPGFSEADTAVLRTLLFHPHHGLRQQAVVAVGRAGDLLALPLLANLYAQGLDLYDHDYIWDAFKDMGDAAVPTLAQIMQEGNAEESLAALWGLGLMGGDGVPVLIEAARRGVARAAESLFNSHDPRAVPVLLEVVARGGKEAAGAAFALEGSCDASCADAVEPILHLYRHAEKEVRPSLLAALGKIGDPRAFPLLVRALRRGGDVTGAAVAALVRFEGREAVEALKGALSWKGLPKERQEEVLEGILEHPAAGARDRQEVSRLALREFSVNPGLSDVLCSLYDYPECRPSVEIARLSGEPIVRLAAAIAGRSVEDFRFALRNGDVRVRRCCAEQVGSLVLTWLEQSDVLDLAADPDACVRKHCAGFPWQETGLDSWPVLERLLKDRSAAVRAAAAANLWATTIEKAVPALRSLARDRSARVRQCAAQSVSQMVGTLSREEWTELLGSFLYDPQGRPVDPVIEEGDAATVSEQLTTYGAPLSRKLIKKWKASGGRRGHPPSPDPWN